MQLSAVIIASFEGLQAARQRLNGSGSSRETAVLFMVGLAIAAFWAGLYFWDRRRRPAPAVNHAMGLFAELCRVHGLSPAERNLLLKAAGDMRNPAIAFVEPNVLSRFGRAHPTESPECDQLLERLFGGGSA
jgi:hypothetical protein